MEILNINTSNIDEVAKRAADFLRAGEVIALPTDTVYGLAADARSEAAVEKVFALKGRGAEKALPVFVSSAKMLDEVACVRDARAHEFLAAVWPGKVTCILPARGWLPLNLRGLPASQNNAPRQADGLLTIAVRIPDNVFVRKVIKKFGGPITGTSANLSGHAACLTARDVVAEFKHLPLKPAAIFDDGSESAGISSTIVDCMIWPPRILRSGAVADDVIMSLIADR